MESTEALQLPNVLTRLAVKALAHTANDHGRRLLYLTTLYSRYNHLQQLEASAIEKLNYLLVVASDDNALRLPVRLGHVYWAEVALDDILNRDVLRKVDLRQMRSLAQKVVAIAPNCLRYGDSTNRMTTDTYQLIRDVLVPEALAAA